MLRWSLSLLLLVLSTAVTAKEAVPAAADPALEARVLRIASELRCLVCQNQTIADSSSDLAKDLRREVREQLRRGATDEQIVRYMTDRYGDFVRYRPAFKASTAVLWIGPAAMLIVGMTTLAIVLRRRSKLAADRFEADEGDDPEDAAVTAPGNGKP